MQTTAGLQSLRLKCAQRAGFATIEAHVEHRRAEHAAFIAQVEREAAQEAATRRRIARPEAVGFYLVSLGGGACFTVSEAERRAAVAHAAQCPGTEVLGGEWMHRRADGRVVRMGAAR